MVTGLQIRMDRILRKGKMLCIPMDHGISSGPIDGLESPSEIIQKCETRGLTSVIINKGILKSLPRPTRIGVLVHFSASTSLSMSPNRKMLTGSVEEAAEHKAERRRQQPRTQAAQTSRNQHRRYEEQVGSLLLKNRIEREASAKGDCAHDWCQSVMKGARPLQGCPRQRVTNAGIGRSLSEARHLLP